MKTGRKNVVNGKEEIVGKVKSERRVICFRDDNFSVDSKSRFADIVDRIPLDADEFIKALTDAIKAEHDKGGRSYEADLKKQAAEKKEVESVQAERAKQYVGAAQLKRMNLIAPSGLVSFRIASPMLPPRLKLRLRLFVTQLG